MFEQVLYFLEYAKINFQEYFEECEPDELKKLNECITFIRNQCNQ